MAPRTRRSAANNSVAESELVRETASLEGMALETRHQIFEILLEAPAGLAQAYQLALASKAMMEAWKTMPLWGRIFLEHKWKTRSKKRAIDESVILEKLKDKHLCHSCLQPVPRSYFVQIHESYSARFCLSCAADVWDDYQYVRDQSYASEAWAKADRETKDGTRRNQGEVLAQSRLPKRIVDLIPHASIQRGGWRYTYTEYLVSPGKQSKDCEANKYILFLQYKPSDILLHEWQHYGGESGKKAEFELESGRTRQAIRAFVDKNFADAGERIGKELDWSGDHVLLEDADANSDANSFGTRIICDLVRSAMAPEFARFDPKLAFPEVAFTVQMPTAIEEFTAWIATERGRKEAHAARDADAAKLLARHSDRARLIDVDLRGLIIRLLRASVLVSDEFIARILNIAQFEQEAGVVRDPAIQPEAKMPDRFEAALKQYLRNRSTPPGAVFTSLKDSELDYLGEPFRTQVAAAIKDFAQNAAAEEISVIMEAAFEGDKKAKLPLKRWIPEIPSVADLIKAFKTKALKAAYPSILTAKFITGKAQQMFNTRAREFAMRLAKEELQREIPSALEELVFGSTQDPDGMLDWAVSLHDLDFSSFLVRGTSIQSTFSLIDEVVSGCSGRLVEKHLSEHGWTWPAEPGCAHLKITREVRDEIQRRVTREVMHRIREAAKPCAITAFGPSVKYESDSTVHALLDRVYSGPIHVSSIWNEAVGERILQEVDLLRASYHLVEPISPEEVEEIAPQLGGPYRIILHDQAFAFISRRNQVIQLRQALANSRAAARKSAIDRAVTSCELADLESTDMPAKAFETIGIDDDADARKAWKESVEGRVRREFASAALSGVVSRESLQQRAPHLVSVAETLERLGLVRDVKYYCKCGFLSRQLGTRDRLMEHIRSSMCGEADILMK